ncbi:exonuclease subunit SbcD [Richelia intracellularis]|uniref:exonuclease subunit SbcD n=1 Tax=Richelia intracellularis TaxID=1164990 RepID=UPI0003491AF1|nr:exonuclease SbcCD subunit D [Richelia intracellularis]
MVKILHLSDIHMGSGFSQGHINPKTGLNSRLEDFINTLSRCIDRALEDPVDMVVFGGDAFPDATPPPYIQQAFANQFRRLVDVDIPTILLVGNHDQHSQGQGGASLCIYRTLGVPGFVVGDTLATHKVITRNGFVQVLTLPWLTRSALMTKKETSRMSLSEINQLLIERLQLVIEGEIRRLDPNLPTILLGHLMTENASFGAERFLAVGKGFTIPLSLLTRPCFDYVALGHVHRHQNLNKTNDPPVIYSGSIERVDFSEEKEDKGYVIIELERGKVKWEFCPLPVRRFCTITVDLSKEEDPQAAIIKAIANHKIKDVVVRLIYKVFSEQLNLIDTPELHKALSHSHSYTIHPELISQLARPRIPELSAYNSINPIDALKTYLNNRQDLSDIANSMIDAAYSLLEHDRETLLQQEIKNKNS